MLGVAVMAAVINEPPRLATLDVQFSIEFDGVFVNHVDVGPIEPQGDLFFSVTGAGPLVMHRAACRFVRLHRLDPWPGRAVYPNRTLTKCSVCRPNLPRW